MSWLTTPEQCNTAADAELVQALLTPDGAGRLVKLSALYQLFRRKTGREYFLFHLLREKILQQHCITLQDRQDLEWAFHSLKDPAASVIWRMMKTYDRFARTTMPLSRDEVAKIAEEWPEA